MIGAAAVAVLTPHEHVAPGCYWWSAREVGEVVPGQRGCLRGQVLLGGALSSGPESGAGTLKVRTALTDPDTSNPRPACPFKPGDSVVVRYHSVFDDGSTIVVIEECR